MAKAPNQQHLTLNTLADTQRLAAAFGACCQQYLTTTPTNDGLLITLDGPMGAGKTTLTQAFGSALGITEAMASPTFVLIHSYQQEGAPTLNHADCYRLEDQADTIADDLLELTTTNAITLVEWASLSPTITQSADLALTIALNDSAPNQREITLTSQTDAGHWVLNQLTQPLEGTA